MSPKSVFDGMDGELVGAIQASADIAEMLDVTLSDYQSNLKTDGLLARHLRVVLAQFTSVEMEAKRFGLVSALSVISGTQGGVKNLPEGPMRQLGGSRSAAVVFNRIKNAALKREKKARKATFVVTGEVWLGGLEVYEETGVEARTSFVEQVAHALEQAPNKTQAFLLVQEAWAAAFGTEMATDLMSVMETL